MNTQGVLVPIVTPFTNDGQVNVAALRQLAGKFADAGAAGIVVCGTTGEYYALEEAERELVLRSVAEEVKGRLSLIAGVTAMSTSAAIRYAQQAQALGYDGLMTAPPPYSLPSQEGLIGYFREVAGSTPLPIVMYDFPARVGVQIEVETVRELARIPNIVAIKESSSSFSRALALIEARIPDFQIICGADDLAADFLFWGVRGWISGTANVFPAEQVAMVRAADEERWDDVKALMSAMYPVIQSMEAGDFNHKAKLGCRRHGVDAGTVRAPLSPLGAEQIREFEDLLDTYGSK